MRENQNKDESKSGRSKQKRNEIKQNKTGILKTKSESVNKSE